MTNRTRTSGGLSPFIELEDLERCSISDIHNEFDIGFDTGSYKIMTDVVIPDFHRRSKRGEIFNNPMTSTTVDAAVSGSGYKISLIGSCPYGATKTQLGSALYNFRVPNATGLSGFLVTPPSPSYSQLRTLASTKAAAGVLPADVMALVEIAEAKATMKMIANPLDDVHRLLDRIRKSRSFRRSRLALGEFVANNWLKYRYGLTPLALTIQSMLDVVTADKASQRKTSRGYSSTVAEASDTQVNTLGDAFDTTVTSHASTKVSVRAGVLYEWHFSWRSVLGIEWSEIPAAAWELVPYSFVVDWFANTGDYLSAITPRAGVQTLASWNTLRHEVEETGTITAAKAASFPSGYQVDQYPEGSYSRTTKTVVRQPGLTVGLAHKIEEIDFVKTKDWLHAVDALYLVVQRLRS